MTWREQYAELLQLIDQTTAIYPHRVFNITPERESTPVRRIAFALENMLDQLKKPLVHDTQSLAQALVYKFNGAHRRQGYWRSYKNLVRLLRRYNEDGLLSRVSDLHKKATASGTGFYFPTVDVLRYVGGAYLKRLFNLHQLQDLCIRTTHLIMGQLELGHWERFSLFMVALCADINSGIGTQVTSMESVYVGFSKFLKPLDNRFPDSFTQLAIFSTLRGQASMKKTADTARVMRLLQLSDEQLESMQAKDQMLKFRYEVLSNMERKTEDVDLGVPVDRKIDDNIEESVEHTVETKINEVITRDERTGNQLKRLKRKKKEGKSAGLGIRSLPRTSKANNIKDLRGFSSYPVPSSSDHLSEVKVRIKKKNKKRRLQEVTTSSDVPKSFPSLDSYVSLTRNTSKYPRKRKQSSFGHVACAKTSLKNVMKKKKIKKKKDSIKY